jgi:hypothetical protein
MSEYSRAEKIDHYKDAVLSGELELTQLREKLKEENVAKDEISAIVNYMSNQLLREEQRKATIVKGKNLLQGGYLLALAGLFLTLATYSGWIDMGNYYVVAYGPFFVGMLLVFRGRNMMKT